ncbi:PROTEIN NEGATIVE REGULATOR OF RESISTANCE [Salix purpurea]|uniref:PROTEIN NEGATIVE REGULATOR OF RESISTANCE n=1 Tax=Salix purpurea TaxID=77065 RepID=A0A9Q0PEV9_SALPP|nr:PROTEIN NEGATIVE REGULATOR OF RESISTANCE [Salix purpurea]
MVNEGRLGPTKVRNHCACLTLTLCTNKGLHEESEKQPRECISSVRDLLLPGLPLHPPTKIIMDGAGKKRKLFNDDLDEEDEEEKIERFFALIKGIREARDRLMNVPDPALKSEMDGKNKKRKLEEEKKQVTAWKPLFQREDFMEETEKLKRPDPSCSCVVQLGGFFSEKGSCEER